MHLKLTIEYDGTGFFGSQLQAAGRGRTVQGELEKALAILAGSPVRIALAGRTDSGVHAAGQVASLDFPAPTRLGSPGSIQKALNGLLPDDLAVVAAEEAADGFHARFSARRRAYRYLIWNAPSSRPLLRRYSLHVRRKLDVGAMAAGAALLEGTQDLAAFAGQGMGVPQRGDDERPGTVRTVSLSRVIGLDPGAGWWKVDAPASDAGPSEADGRLLAIDLVANAFLPQMVRTIVGTLLEVGYGKRSAADIQRIMDSRDRRLAGPTAKPQALCLLWVEY